MATLKKKAVEDSTKVEHPDSVVVKKQPVKAQPAKNGIGGIFAAKVAAIMKKILGKE